MASCRLLSDQRVAVAAPPDDPRLLHHVLLGLVPQNAPRPVLLLLLLNTPRLPHLPLSRRWTGQQKGLRGRVQVFLSLVRMFLLRRSPRRPVLARRLLCLLHPYLCLRSLVRPAPALSFGHLLTVKRLWAIREGVKAQQRVGSRWGRQVSKGQQQTLAP